MLGCWHEDAEENDDAVVRGGAAEVMVSDMFSTCWSGWLTARASVEEGFGVRTHGGDAHAGDTTAIPPSGDGKERCDGGGGGKTSFTSLAKELAHVRRPGLPRGVVGREGRHRAVPPTPLHRVCTCGSPLHRRPPSTSVRIALNGIPTCAGAPSPTPNAPTRR